MIPEALKAHTKEMLRNAIIDVCKEKKYNEDEVTSLFEERVFKYPKNPALQQSLSLSPLAQKKVVCVHELYSDPDSSCLSSIKNDEKKLQGYREEMKTFFGDILETVLSLASVVKAEAHAPAPVPAAIAITNEELMKWFDPLPKASNPPPAAAIQAGEPILIPLDFAPPAPAPVNQSKQPVHPEVITVAANDVYELPANSTGCKIEAKEESIVNLGHHCSKIEVITVKSSVVILGQHCKDIRLIGEGSCDYDSTCTVIKMSKPVAVTTELQNVINAEKKKEVRDLLKPVVAMLRLHLGVRSEAVQLVFDTLVFNCPYNSNMCNDIRPAAQGWLSENLLKIHAFYNNPTRLETTANINTECAREYRRIIEEELLTILRNESHPGSESAAELVRAMIPDFFKELKDRSEIERIFNQYVFKTPYVKNLCEASGLSFSEPEFAQAIQILHKRYNNPSITNEETVENEKTQAFRNSLKECFKENIKLLPAAQRVNNFVSNQFSTVDTLSFASGNGMFFAGGPGMVFNNFSMGANGISFNSAQPSMSNGEIVHNIGSGEVFALSNNTSQCKIVLSAGSVVTIGENCHDITVLMDSGSKLSVGKNSHHMTIAFGTGSDLIVDDDCHDFHITMAIAATWSIPLSCHNIFINGTKVR